MGRPVSAGAESAGRESAGTAELLGSESAGPDTIGSVSVDSMSAGLESFSAGPVAAGTACSGSVSDGEGCVQVKPRSKSAESFSSSAEYGIRGRIEKYQFDQDNSKAGRTIHLGSSRGLKIGWADSDDGPESRG